MTRTDFLQLRYGAGQVIEPFLIRLFGEPEPKAIYWVSPWMTHLDFKTATTRHLLRKLAKTPTNLVVITREPDRGSAHEEFVRDALELARASVFYMPTLHAKFYVAATSDRRYALVGSANMYQWSSTSYELGIIIDARGDGEVLVDKLEELAIDLRLAPHTVQAK